MEVIPVINCPDVECAAERVKQISEFLDEKGWVHLDVADARFTFGKSWGDPAGWRNFGKKFNLEVHLMVEQPEKIVEGWARAGAKRFIVHAETLTAGSAKEILKIVKKYKAEVMLSSNPETSAEALRPYFKDFSEFQVLAVYPGPAGQKFLPTVLEKIRFLRREMPNAKIEVDGGINPETARLVKEAGANVVAVATYLFGSPDLGAAFKELEKV